RKPNNGTVLASSAKKVTRSFSANLFCSATAIIGPSLPPARTSYRLTIMVMRWHSAKPSSAYGWIGGVDTGRSWQASRSTTTVPRLRPSVGDREVERRLRWLLQWAVAPVGAPPRHVVLTTKAYPVANIKSQIKRNK